MNRNALDKMKFKRIHRVGMIVKAIIFIALALLLSGCFPGLLDFEDPDKTANDYIYEYFQEWYLWYNEIPAIDPNSFETYQDLVDTMIVEQDHWSFAGSWETIRKLLESGESKGFGAGFIIDYDDQIKITHVYNKSPMGDAGIERGWVINNINGFTVEELDSANAALNSDGAVEFIMTDLQGNTQTKMIEKADFEINTVLHQQVIEKDGVKIGYLVFNSFLETSENELIPVFEEFKEKNITNLIVDLRYNGGGVVDIAGLLIGIIGGNKVEGQVFATNTHNDKKSKYNEEKISEHAGVKLDIDHVHFITTDGTASASEMVINCLKPFMNVTQIGSETHGKPVGMYVFSVEKLDLAILPVSFKTINNSGYGDYYNGLPADILEYDDLDHNWGDEDEAMLKTAIDAIVEPLVVAGSDFKSQRIKKQRLFEYSGIKQYISAY